MPVCLSVSHPNSTVSATCHSNCPTGAGCFGPRLLSLCGSCQPLAAGGDTCQFNTSQGVQCGGGWVGSGTSRVFEIGFNGWTLLSFG